MKRTKKSQKKTKFLLLLIVLTAVLSITATYAWFSTQKVVEISTMRLNIEVAESLQISLDGETWVQSISISDMRQFYGTYGGGTNPHQAKADDNTNYVPTELLPVSTTGTVADGKLQFMKAKTVSGKSMVAEKCTEDITKTAAIGDREENNALHPYLVFDMYLNNISAQTAGDPLRLAKGSKVFVDSTTEDIDAGKGTTGTGLENCVRVAFVPYTDKAITAATSDGATVRAINGAESTVSSAVIWEPNHLDHTATALANTTRTITMDEDTGKAEAAVPTFGVIYAASEVTVANTDAAEATSGITAAQTVLTPTYDETGTSADIALTDVTLPQNTITKVRTYIWIEGQDVDCINTASMGGMLQVKLKLDKAETNTGTNNTYTGTGVETP